jgi:prepilin-type N-terminal cleavage/methylation domain-containing protein
MKHNNSPVLPAKGFTLVETLVAITILLVAIAGPFFAIQKSITAAYVARDQLVATALSQEGIEYIYALRNNNYLQSQLATPKIYSWLSGIDGTTNANNDNANCFTPTGCTLDPTQQTLNLPSLVACGVTPCSPLTLNTTSIRYTQDLANPVTKFTRKISMSSFSPSTEATITVVVSWITLGKPYSITTKDELYNWQ